MTLWLPHSPLAPPSIKLLLDDPLVVNLGESITLVCVVTGGEPAPTLRWVGPGGGPVPSRSVVQRGTLTIPAVTLQDAGPYSCLASNNVGNPAKRTTNILVRGSLPPGGGELSLCVSVFRCTHTRTLVSPGHILLKWDSSSFSFVSSFFYFSSYSSCFFSSFSSTAIPPPPPSLHSSLPSPPFL